MSLFFYCMLPLFIRAPRGNCHLRNSQMSGSGTLMAAVQNTGYGMLPAGIYRFCANSFHPDTSGHTLGRIRPSLSCDNPGFTREFSGPGFILRCGHLWICSTRHTHRISFGSALIAAGVSAIITGLAYSPGLREGKWAGVEPDGGRSIV
jgi:hypothetical protein